MPQISVITPSFNGERFIENCIKNVIEQNCQEAEHVIVDGGSTDGTIDIIHHYAQNYSHIRWISEPDQGQSDAMNKGIAMASGNILGFLNVDDYYEPNVLNQVLEIFKTLPNPSLLVGNCNVWGDDGSLVTINKPRKLELNQLLLGYYIHPFPINPSAYFYHKHLHDKIGLYDVNDHYSMDVDFLLRAVQAANVKYVDVVWGNYRQIRGTKTVNDINMGNNAKRVDKIFRKYRSDLPTYQRWMVTAIYWVVSRKLISTLLFFYRNPNELSIRVKKRMNALWRVFQ